MVEADREIAEWLASARHAVAFTGAGVSTESGIPDFRSPGGIWANSQPVEFADFVARADARREYWRQKAIAHRDFAASRPNAGHLVLARWERRGLLKALITQNIDGLHQDAGSREVLELHGTARWIACLGCRARFPADPLVAQFLSTDTVPDCPSCGGLLKHATISFGQTLDPTTLERATQLAARSDLFLVLGSSLVVYPAAGLPELARRSGARLAIINREATGQDDAADLVVHAPIGQTLSAIDLVLGASPVTAHAAGSSHASPTYRPPAELTTWEYLASDEAGTERLGAVLANCLLPGTAVALIGTLGAGKTRLVQAIARGCGIPAENVTSPTFVLCQHYRGRLLLHHLDAYRLRDADEFLELGPEEYFASDGITCVEWADRVHDCLPAVRLEVAIEVAGDTLRLFRLTAHGEPVRRVLAEIVGKLGD